MANYVCPSCGAAFNGKKCRACNYEHFSEEIAHGGHTHRGEPLVIDSPVRRPIPRKDPFGCEKQTRKSPFSRGERKKHPFLGLLVILMIINSLMPLLRSWGLELEAMEAANVQPEMALPEERVVLQEEGPITIFTEPRYLKEFSNGTLRIWVENDQKNRDVYVNTRYVMVNGFVLPASGVYVDVPADSCAMSTLYIYEEELEAAYIREIRELTFVLEVVDEDYMVLFETDPITFSADGRPVEQPAISGGLPLIDEDGLLLQYLGHWMDEDYPGYENGRLRFYVENNTDRFLTMNSLTVTLDGEAVDLFLWADLPAGSKAVVEMELWGLEGMEFDSPRELEDLDMTVEFWSPEDYSGSVKEYNLSMPMVREVPLVVS